MALSLLDTQVLENIVGWIDIDDKSNLFLVGNILLSKKLSSIETDVFALTRYEVWKPCKAEEDGAVNASDWEVYNDIIRQNNVSPNLYRKLVRRTRTDVADAVFDISNGNTIYNIIPLRYVRARHAAIHGNVLQRVATEMTQLESLYVYLYGKHIFPTSFPSTLTELVIVFDFKYDEYSALRHLPSTLLRLGVSIDSLLTINRMIIDYNDAKLLPSCLETLIGVDIDAKSALALPRTLTKLEYGECTRVQYSSLPSGITDLQCISILHDVAGLLYFSSLQSLTFFCGDRADLENLHQLHTLTSLNIDMDHRSNNNSIVFPSRLTRLNISSYGNACCILPSPVKNAYLGIRFNMFYSNTRTWIYNGDDCPTIVPDRVRRAVLATRDGTTEQLHAVFDTLKDTIESFDLKYINIRNQRRNIYFNPNYDFAKFTKCKELKHPWM